MSFTSMRYENGIEQLLGDCVVIVRSFGKQVLFEIHTPNYLNNIAFLALSVL